MAFKMSLKFLVVKTKSLIVFPFRQMQPILRKNVLIRIQLLWLRYLSPYRVGKQLFILKIDLPVGERSHQFSLIRGFIKFDRKQVGNIGLIDATILVSFCLRLLGNNLEARSALLNITDHPWRLLFFDAARDGVNIGHGLILVDDSVQVTEFVSMYPLEIPRVFLKLVGLCHAVVVVFKLSRVWELLLVR